MTAPAPPLLPEDAPTYADVESAARRIAGVAHRTPVLTSTTIDRLTGAQVYFKAEPFQRMGAFKFRGAYNAASRIAEQAAGRGVIAFSSGNHAQAVALAASLLGLRATIVMPNDAPRVKLDATRGYGAGIVQYDPATEDREAIGRALANEHGLALIPPYDHPHVIAGQGTAARELLEDVGPLDVLFVCCGGGGLLSGSALSARALSPHCRVIGVEPDAGDDGVRSFTSRTLQRVHHPQTIADGARTPSLGRYTFPMILRDVDHMMSVSDEALLGAMRLLWERMKVLVEPTGALGAAALLSGREAVAGTRVGVILSGGNVDMGRWFQPAS
mgnify:CR=1 FL=1|jgi:threonine dehydratase